MTHLALIVWEDATASADWKHDSDIGKSELATVHSIGWVVYRDDKKLIMHSAIISGENVSGGEQVIPVANIIEEKQVIITGSEQCQNA